MNTSRLLPYTYLLLVVSVIGLHLHTSALAQDRGHPEYTLVNFGTFLEDEDTRQGISGTPFGLPDLRLSDVLQRGGAVTLESEDEIEAAFVVGVLQGGKILTQQQSQAFTIRPGTYTISEAEGSFFILERQEDPQGDPRVRGAVEPHVVRVEVPEVLLTAPKPLQGRFGDPRNGLSIEPVILEYDNPMRDLEGGVWELITEDIGIKRDGSVFAFTIQPTNERLRRRLRIGQTLIPVMPPD